MDIQGTQQEKPMVSAVYAKIFALMQDIHAAGVIPKDGNNQEQHYKFLSEKQVKLLIQPLLVKHKLLFLPLGQRITATGTTPKGTQRITDVSVLYRWVDAESGEFIEGEFIGSGTDSNDKGVYKALTGGGKQCMCNTFWIPTGDDPDKGQGDSDGERNRVTRRSDQRQSADSPINQGQRNRLFALANAAKVPVDRVKEIVGAFGYESSSDIKVKDYEAICREINPDA
jgi:hypothetical protein